MNKGLNTRIIRWVSILAVMIAAAVLFTGFAFAGTTTTSRYTGITYTHSDALDNCIIVDGIDVSEFQGNIDWAKVKADGIDFAIIRVGGRGYTSGKLYDDCKFKRNIRGAKKNGIMVGVYFFSQATSKKRARSEVDYAISLIEEAGYTANDLDLPLFMDYERIGGEDGLLYDLTKSEGTEIAKTWLSYAASKGYTAGIYTDLYFGKTKVNGSELSKKYNYWAAQYYTANQFSFDYCWWQYSDAGYVYGIGTNTTDMDFWYIDPVYSAVEEATGIEDCAKHAGFNTSYTASVNSTKAKTKPSLADAEITITGDTDYVYDGVSVFKPKVTVKYNGVKLTKNTDYKLRYIKNTQAGTAYAIAIGMGDYAGYVMADFKIKKSTDVDSLVISDVSDRVYTGSGIVPALNITDQYGRPLRKKVDYKVKGTDNIDAGKATLTVTFRGNYKGSRTVDFNIIKAEQEISVKDDRKVTVLEEGAYDLGVKVKFPATVKYTSSDEKVAKVDENGKVTPLKKGTTVIRIKAKSNKNVGYAVKKIKLEVKRKYLTASEKKLAEAVKGMTFKLKTKKTSEGIKLTWTKVGKKKLDYVQVYRSKTKDSGYKKLATKDGSVRSHLNYKYLKKGRYYYYKIRGVRIINEKKFYTKWSNVAKRKWD
ncbi:MAG: glycoside hydrolase family 25 protein [Firmicutes bacterium]|nr:glycoside hydrolase family 25 protein [Bacillota bacterium]